MKFSPRQSAWCDTDYVPTTARQQRCGTCLTLDPRAAGRCPECGSVVSGRALWGLTWGGGCDRAETRVAELMARLKPAADLPEPAERRAA